VRFVISEGTGRNSNKEFVHFLGSLNGLFYELQTQLIISNNLGLMTTKLFQPLLIEEIQKMDYTFKNTLQTKLQSRQDMEISAFQV
jgi:four helix bundle protein